MRRILPLGSLAALCYVPLLFTAPGRVGADTKSYLYLDPARLLSRATSMWDPDVGLGTVTHQTIGYLFPMGPWYWLFDTADIPDWVAQRLWLGSILFLAGAGAWFLLRNTLGFEQLPATVAAFAYALTPYTLALDARLSAILLPFTALPWLIALTIRALRTGGWRHPALFALVVVAVGGVNATALVFAGIGPLLWIPFAVCGVREVTLAQAGRAVARIAALTTVTSLWWLGGLYAQSRYGIEILRYTETAAVVASASVAPEVLRGLGYWFFYGGDRLGPWIEPGRDYTQRLWLLAVTYAVPITAFAAAVATRWRHRAYFVALAVTGVFVAVGAHPWKDPPPAGAAWKALLGADIGLALRSTPRAVPLVALGLAVLLGAGVAALARNAPRAARAGGLAVVAAAMLGLPPLWTGGMVAANLDRPEEVPAYWQEAAAHLDWRPHDTRVLELPGADFASYRWGNTVDPITPGLMDRPYVARELIPYGSPASADLLNALDRRVQENLLAPDALTPIARLLSVGDVVARNDLQFERYRLARPYWVSPLLDTAPGLGSPATFGTFSGNTSSSIAPMDDEAALRDRDGVTYPPVAAYPVDDALPITRTAAAGAPVVVAGDGESLVGLAAAGLIDGDEIVLYSASFANDPDVLHAILADDDAALVVTDGNRRRGRRWSTVRDNVGYTEAAGEDALVDDPTDNRLPVFPDAGDTAYTVAEHPGGVRAQATSYGNPISFTPEFRPSMAIDGDLRTAWRTASSADVRGERLRLHFDPPVTTDRVRLTQLLDGFRNRWITGLTLRIDGGVARQVDLGESSRAASGEEVVFGERTFTTLELTIEGDDSGREPAFGRPVRWNGLSSVGFAEVEVGGRTSGEILRLPTDLLDAAGQGSLDHPLTIVLERARQDPAESVRDDEEPAMARAWEQPTARTFALTGRARLSARAPDDRLDSVLRQPVVATATRRLPGDVRARASSAVDGDLDTWWSPAFDVSHEADAITIWSVPEDVDRLDLVVLDDGLHSVPTRLRISDGSGMSFEVDVPLPVGGRAPVPFPQAISASQLTIEILEVREVTTIDWFSDTPIRMPVGIVELGLSGVSAFRPEDPNARLDTGCRADLLTVDGEPIGIRIAGTLDQAERRRSLEVELCGEDAPGLQLDPGRHELRAVPGRDTGIDLDGLVLQSAAGDGAPGSVRPLVPGKPTAPPAVTVTAESRTSIDLRVDDATVGEPFWVVLGQSHNAGWEISVDGGTAGPHRLVNGYANGWLVDPTAADLRIEITWVPQSVVWLGLVASALGVVLCLALAAAGRPYAGTAAVDRPEAMVWRRVRRAPGDAVPSMRTAVLTALALGAAAAAAIGLAPGAVVAVAAAWGCRRAGARFWLALAAPGCLAVAALYVVGRQARSRPTAAFEWPAEQASVHQLAWTALAMVVVTVAVDRAWTRTNGA